MRRLSPLLLAFVLFTVIGIPFQPAFADGIIIPDPPICDPGPCPEPYPFVQLAIEYHRVHVTIEDQVAITRVDQVFRNDNDWTVEGTYVFPIPTGAAVTEFTLYVDGKPVEGRILERDEARKTYEEIVRALRDPALLEYVDRDAVQASVFPIAPGERRRIELEYTEVLEADNGLVRYRYPLNTEKFSTLPLEDVSVTVEASSPYPIRAIYSPSHPVDIQREGNYHFNVSYEAYDVIPDKDFELYYSFADEDIGLNLITYRNPEDADSDGFFLLLAAPSVEVDQDQVIAKDVFIVLDQSGSMDGEKFEQAREALHYILDHLHDEDRFNIIAFSSGTRSFDDRLSPMRDVSSAHRWVDSLSAAGSTDINLALLEALAQVNPERSTFLIFLTDGLPTEGETDTEEILKNIEREASRNVRLFAFGVGYDVDTFLLDTLAGQNHGATTYVSPGGAIDEAVSGFYAKVSTPVLTMPSLDFGEIVTYDMYPDPLPDLFAGSQFVVVGRYRNAGSATVRLEGEVEGKWQHFDFSDQTFRRSGGADFLPRLWATRKIGALLNEVRLGGPEKELVDQIVNLSIRYGIVTPYTSYLVTEPEALSEEARDSIANDAFEKMLSTPSMTFGEAAVERAAAESGFSGAEVPLTLQGDAADVVSIAGSRTYRLVEGVWIDTGFDEGVMTTMRVPFLSEDYFALAASRPDLAAALALGENVITIADGVAYEIVGTDDAADSITLPPAQFEEPSADFPAASSPPVDQPVTDNEGGITLPCGASLLAIGFAWLPFAHRRRQN
jgi:Ca-activated chloride channel family protein